MSNDKEEPVVVQVVVPDNRKEVAELRKKLLHSATEHLLAGDSVPLEAFDPDFDFGKPR